MQREDVADREADWHRWKRGVAIEALAKERGVTRERMRIRLAKMDENMTQLALITRAEQAEAERDALQGQLNDLRNGWANSVKAHAALLAERDAAFAAGLEAAAEAVLYLCRMKGMGNRTIDGPEAAHLIRALPIKDRPDGR